MTAEPDSQGGGAIARTLSRVAVACLAALAFHSPAARAQIVNEAVATGVYAGSRVTSAPSTRSAPLAAARPQLEISLEGALRDDDGVAGLSAGDSVAWRARLRNSGNVTLTGIAVEGAGPLSALSPEGGRDPGPLAPGDSLLYEAATILDQSDLDANAGGGEIVQALTAGSDQTPAQSVRGTVAIEPKAGLRLAKQVVSVRRVFAGLYDVEVLITAANAGNVTLKPLQIADSLAGVMPPAAIVAGPFAAASGFGEGRASAGYDGVSSDGLLDGEASLAPGQEGQVAIRFRIDTGGGEIDASGSATAVAPQLAEPVPSDDPSATPEDSADNRATALVLRDLDGDGALDREESSAEDRDGDGAVDAADHDPTGYFYCESDGKILPGGRITVTNLDTGASQEGEGSSNGIAILRDGDDGRYRFQVREPGLYRLSYALPPGGVASASRLPLATLDLSSARAARGPVAVGSGEYGSTGRLADHSAAANPFHLDFRIAAGDPPVFNNNIPLRFCGEARLAVTKRLLEGPAQTADGRSRVVYLVAVASAGVEPVREITVIDDMEAAFGAGRFSVSQVTLARAPPGFAGSVNPEFDGEKEVSLLTGGGELRPGDRVEIEIAATIDAPSGVYDNLAVAQGLSPLDSSLLPPARGAATTLLVAASGTQDLSASMAASPEAAAPGERVSWRIEIANALAGGRDGTDIVAQLPEGFSYAPGSARIDGAAAEPLVDGRELSWAGRSIDGGGQTVATFDLVAGETLGAGEFAASAYARDPVSGLAISNVAAAVVRVRDETAAACADIAGRVFEDLNGDGVAQDSEPGVSGASLVAGRGATAVTDGEGRYRFACADLSEAAGAANIVVKLDERTLPAGRRATGENPRTPHALRLAEGDSSVDFAVSAGRLVEFEIDAEAFEEGRTRLTPAGLAAVNQLLEQLREPQMVLRIAYRDAAGDPLAEGRLELLSALVKAAHGDRHPDSQLQVETRLLR